MYLLVADKEAKNVIINPQATRTATKNSSEYVVHICNSGIANCYARPGGHPDCVRPAIRIKKKTLGK